VNITNISRTNCHTIKDCKKISEEISTYEGKLPTEAQEMGVEQERTFLSCNVIWVGAHGRH
jgi:hypothetical protein